MKKFTAGLLLALLFVPCPGQDNDVQTQAVRDQIDLSGTWSFRADPENVGDSEGWFRSESGKKCWPLVNVPVAFDNCGPGLERYFGTAWYSKTLFVPESFRGRRIILRFEGINYNAVVWVNGIPVGENHDAFLPFGIPVNEVIKTGSENNITVSVNNIRQRGQFPLFEGWYGQGGFLREAYLIATGKIYIAGTTLNAIASIDCQNHQGHLTVHAKVNNESIGTRPLRINVTVRDINGKTFATITSSAISIGAGAKGELSVEGNIPDVQWWSPDSPVLYDAEVSLIDGKKIVDKLILRTGFRTIEVKDAKILVNGEQVFLLGFNRHEDSPCTGMAADLRQVREDLTQMKKTGCNYIRLCHYPHHPGELDLCDELGLFVLAENAMNEWGHIDHPAPNPSIPLGPADAPIVIGNARRTLTKMIDRDNHHPSIIIWSVSNENEETRKDVSEGNDELIRFGRTIDRSRLWTHVSNSFRKEGWENFYRFDDVIAVNVYPTHWYTATEEEINAGLPESTRIMRDTLKRLHDKFPQKPIIIGEYGFPDGDRGEAGARKQAVATEAEFKGLTAPYIAGAGIWCYARHPWPWNNFSNYGYVSRDRMSFFPALSVVERLYKNRTNSELSVGQIPVNLQIVARSDNDLVNVLKENKIAFKRADNITEAITNAPAGSGIMVLADYYPEARTMMDSSMFAAASGKNLRVYIEYPSELPGMHVGEAAYIELGEYGAVIERTVVSSDVFGPELPKMSILEMKDCHYIQMSTESPFLVLARVEGYNTAVYGLPQQTKPLLFGHPEGKILVATTKLSQFVTGRYAPNDAWPYVIGMILKWTTGNSSLPVLKWTPTVRPMFSSDVILPEKAQFCAVKRGIEYYDKSMLFLHPEWPESNGMDSIAQIWPRGDGTFGIGECYSSKRIFYTGRQAASLSARSDCNLETATGLACGARLLKEADYYRDKAHTLNDFIAFNSKACQETRADSTSPSFGLIGYYAFNRGSYWGDDNARSLLSLIISSALLNEDRWDETIVRGILANFRTSGIHGFRPLNISEVQLQKNGWQYYFNLDHVDYCPHMQCYLWCTYLWLYDKTQFKPFLERTREGIEMMMKAYPGWRLEANRAEQERCRMLLPLAWLVRVDDTPEHRAWLDTIARYIIGIQDKSGAVPQIPGSVVSSNNGYGTGECAMAHKEGDPVTDALYSINFAFLGMTEAASATGNVAYIKSAEKMADFFIRTQTQSQKHSELDGTWYRGFDYTKWDYWGSDGDAGWGVWSNEIGWTHSWITATLAIREMKTSFWELSSGSKVNRKFNYYRKMMLPDNILQK
jgi:hypothetical protein